MELTPRTANGFLSSLAADDFDLIRPHLKPADLHGDSVLVGAGDALRHAWLPHRGVISLVVNLSKGEHVQVAMIGRDSIFGVFSSLGDPVALTSAVCWCPAPPRSSTSNICMRRPSGAPRCAALMMRHGLAMYAQVQQTAGCNAAHPVESRMARYLLQIHDLSGGVKLVLTQEDGANDRRPAQQRLAGGKHAAASGELIHYSRGHIEISIATR